MSATILTVAAVGCSSLDLIDKRDSQYSCTTRLRISPDRSATLQRRPICDSRDTNTPISGLVSTVEACTSDTRAATHRENAKGGPSASRQHVPATQRLRSSTLLAARTHLWIALYDGLQKLDRNVGYAAEVCSFMTAVWQAACSIIQQVLTLLFIEPGQL